MPREEGPLLMLLVLVLKTEGRLRPREAGTAMGRGLAGAVGPDGVEERKGKQRKGTKGEYLIC